MLQLPKVCGADHEDVCCNVSCVSTGVQVNPTDPVGVESDNQVQVEAVVKTSFRL